jgi:hypothetical protein
MLRLQLKVVLKICRCSRAVITGSVINLPSLERALTNHSTATASSGFFVAMRTVKQVNQGHGCK